MTVLREKKPVFKKLTQVGMVVKDVEATAKHYWDDLGIGPWRFYTVDPSNTPNITLHSRPVRHAFRAALATIGDVSLELIQPLDGPSVYADHLAAHGEGLHHLAFQVEEYEAAKAHLREKGYAEIQRGQPFGACTYSYFDTDKKLAFMTEFGSGLMEGKAFPPPEHTYP